MCEERSEQAGSEEVVRRRREKIKEGHKEQVMTTNLVDQELELDDSSVALVLTVALHPCTAKAKSLLSQRKLERCQEGSCRNRGKPILKMLQLF